MKAGAMGMAEYPGELNQPLYMAVFQAHTRAETIEYLSHYNETLEIEDDGQSSIGRDMPS